ncbi:MULTISPECIES: lycopene cyclase family protein [unclassified Streptomyces]|uniref:lycopene cyclase family protein n=1 Tax=unclassified Streptomyces TaxID=2593676 RepID=UPI000DBAAED7|nr:lycopene cyclase family protein [Streptomyces sp. PsTaAH-137]MYT74674.1 lycopene cyclase [Streptomyces sp. SID8367]
MSVRSDVVIIGAGAAGLSLAERLCTATRPAPSVRLIDAPAGPLRPPPRTWCFWEHGPGRYDDAVTASWNRIRVRAPDGRTIDAGTGALRYKMIRSTDFEATVAPRLAAHGSLTRTRATVETVEEDADGARVIVRTAEGRQESVPARWVFDSRPLGSLPPARTTLLQHFRGWFVRTGEPAFDTGAVDLMDFRTPQPERGLAFTYVLPTGERSALVEYTQFSPSVLPTEEYDSALRAYLHDVLGVRDARIEAREEGVIPMTDARFARRVGRSTFRIGAAGGATRPATGYTFATIQRQTAAIAAALLAGRDPAPPAPHSKRSMAMDAVLLHGLDSGRIDGAAFFTRLFSRVPMERLLRFLDGETALHEDLSIGLNSPIVPLLRSAVELPTRPLRPAPTP